MVTEMTRKCDN